MASSAHEQQPISLDGEVCSRAARDFCVAGLTGSRSLPFRRSGVAFFAYTGATWSRTAGSAAAAAGRLLAGPGAVRTARRGGSLLDPLVLDPRAPKLLARSGSA